MRPEMIVPPMWNLLFYVPDYGLWQAKRFVIEVTVENCAGNGNLTVVDAMGEHLVAILPAHIGESEAVSTYVNA